VSAVAPYVFRHEPFPYQREEWEKYRDSIGRAIFWEQGLGKSKETIDQACWNWMQGNIDAVCIVAPNGVHRNWVEEEIPAHVPEAIMKDVRAMVFQSEKSGTKRHKAAVKSLREHRGFAWFTISYEAFNTKEGKEALIEFFSCRKVFYVLDEAHYIKNPDAKRTESILKSAKYAERRRVLTGTPIAVGPFDIYPQIEFLQPGFWYKQGFSEFIEFKKHFGVFEKVYNPTARVKKWNEEQQREVWGIGGEVDVLVGFRRLDELNAIISPLSSRLTKEDSGLNLPPKRYRKARFPMTPEQQVLYDEMKEEAMAWIAKNSPEGGKPLQAALQGFCATCEGKREINEGGYIYQCPDCNGQGEVASDEDGIMVIAKLPMIKLLRLQQITCGYLPTEDEEEPVHIIPGERRRLMHACNIIEQRTKAGRKVIVWARFKLDIDQLLEELRRREIKSVRYDGTMGEQERADAKALFKGERPVMVDGTLIGREKVPPEEQAMVWVGNPAAGATGLTLTIAKTVLYYSNSFKLIDRLQSEDRAHRIGQDEEVEYIDMMAEDSVDDKIIDSHRNKKSIACEILGDQLRAWI